MGLYIMTRCEKYVQMGPSICFLSWPFSPESQCEPLDYAFFCESETLISKSRQSGSGCDSGPEKHSSNKTATMIYNVMPVNHMSDTHQQLLSWFGVENHKAGSYVHVDVAVIVTDVSLGAQDRNVVICQRNPFQSKLNE